MPNVNGILESALYVRDVPASRRFYEATLGFEVMDEDAGFCALSVCDGQVLLLFARGSSVQAKPTGGGTIPPHDASGRMHLAFAIDASDLHHWEEQLAGQGVAIESKVVWQRGGTSIYFRDPDGNLVELATPGVWSNY
jgi:catechol 2,3-dioxygenase-like lactoylglutathione lyase family enzyme